MNSPSEYVDRYPSDAEIEYEMFWRALAVVHAILHDVYPLHKGASAPPLKITFDAMGAAFKRATRQEDIDVIEWWIEEYPGWNAKNLHCHLLSEMN